MSQSGAASASENNRPALLATVASVAALALFVGAMTGAAEWAWPVSIVMGLAGAGLGMQGRKLARGGAPMGGLATAAMAVGALLAAVQLIWIVLNLMGIVEE